LLEEMVMVLYVLMISGVQVVYCGNQEGGY